MLSVSDLHLYHGASHTLRGVTLDARKGEVTCVLGRNGVGKTSFLRALLGLAPVARGTIEWEGERLERVPTHKRAARGVAYVPQGRDIFPRLTVAENLETAFAALPRAERFVPDEVFALFPVLKTMLRRRGGDLSGGQQQQLAIGRALVTRPRLLVLDEPTEGIQPSIITHIGEVLTTLAASGTLAVLLVEQYLDFARRIGTRVAVMDRGRIVLDGMTDSLDEAEVRRHLMV